MTSSSFHCCASCIHFEVRKRTKIDTGLDNRIELNKEKHIVTPKEHTTYQCSRLGFETKPTFQFNCWTPKEQVEKLMNKKNAT